MEKAVVYLLNKLEGIGKAHKELYDTDVKEQTAQWFIEIFFNGNTTASPPMKYGMFSDEGNKAIQAAFRDFAGQLMRSGDFGSKADDEKWIVLRSSATIHGTPAEDFLEH
jgi:hypothetical protein